VIIHSDRYLFAVESEIRDNHTGSEMRFVSEHRVANIAEMRNLGLVEDDAVFEFARITEDDAITNDHVLPDITTTANLAIVPDPCWTLDGGPVLDNRVMPDVNVVTDKCASDDAPMDSRFQVELEIAPNLA
jgi:hypothetical protein